MAAEQQQLLRSVRWGAFELKACGGLDKRVWCLQLALRPLTKQRHMESTLRSLCEEYQ